ncbi:zf-HC2 domain-containing protein [Corynebacterium pygosceleis]|uniref:Zf-HC2 domain-containing protein n=1 Tax=Corynebacterium pygosceleis TaxID=2800406 RepID=A0A9Q4GK52_9CORY|nr:zf-HC2 domain-containing protein [Corynebacterium pygosceleis]MCK7638113.1 zf-HC2 domain-containing protein [Corynebacterium pygosceleis]MCK7675827.1 zf-HC2 domain-containing protein [Corynebacterium pygosceleis]MCL0120791.1 zf-HC2 domain-containing protein [Corynebacterium pygosceleis]MCX7444332.1 zf-HC2 domain-containing protein [Corynebacterium pygosceleis]MCX7468829.1 zf-HC2 domain-containing protein [Corynebacterium pygosceleis]
MIDCVEVQRALSARLDGEPAGIDDDVVDAHVAACGECRAFLDSAAALNRQLKLSTASESGPMVPPDLSASILAGIEPEMRRRAATRAFGLALSRVALVGLGVAYVIWAIVLLGSSAAVSAPPADPLIDTSVTAGLFVDAAAVRLALGVGLFFAAWRPRNAAGMLPVYGALWAFSFGFATREVVLGYASASDVFGLVLLLVSTLVLLWTWLSGFGLAAMGRAWRAVTAQPD